MIAVMNTNTTHTVNGKEVKLLAVLDVQTYGEIWAVQIIGNGFVEYGIVFLEYESADKNHFM